MRENKDKENALSHDRLLSLLDYDRMSGTFRWIRRQNRYANRIKVGDIAGGSNKVNEYWQIRINDYLYTGHRLAWFYVYGRWPVNELDHINRDKTDNRISNLREATHIENMRYWHDLRKTNTKR